jgi:hypothetical protein
VDEDLDRKFCKIRVGPFFNGKNRAGPFFNGKNRAGPLFNGKNRAGPLFNGKNRAGPYFNGNTRAGPYFNGNNRAGPYFNGNIRASRHTSDVKAFQNSKSASRSDGSHKRKAQVTFDHGNRDGDCQRRCRFSGRCGRSSVRQALPERPDDSFVNHKGHFDFYNGTFPDVFTRCEVRIEI